MKSLPLALLVCCLGGCVVGEEAVEGGGDLDAQDDDHVLEEESSDSTYNQRGWTLPAAVQAIGDQQYVPYTGAGAWAGGANCGGGLLAGTRELGDYLQATFSGINGYGGYACRPNTANTSELSVHGTGRAIDIMISGTANSAVGDPIANYLVQNAEKIGVQYIIWNRNSWNASRSAPNKLRAYGGPNPHTDHVHVELTPAGAQRMTEWFGDNAPPPPESDTATVTASALNLRTGPSTSYTILGQMPNGATVTILQGPSNGWYNVTYNGTTGWCFGDYLAF